MRPILCYILIVAAAAFIAMFFVSQHSRQVQIGYELTRLRRERDTLRELGRKLEFEISKAGAHDALTETARKLGLDLRPPASGRGPD